MFAVSCDMKRRAITVSPGGQLCKFILMLIPVFVRWHYLPERWNLFLRHHASCKSCVLAAVTRVESRRDDAPPWVIKRENRPPDVIKERTVSTRQEMAFLPLQFLFPSSWDRERGGKKDSNRFLASVRAKISAFADVCRHGQEKHQRLSIPCFSLPERTQYNLSMPKM